MRSGGFPVRGAIAGCGVAPYHTQAYAGPFISRFSARHPDVSVSVHYDDLCTAVVGPSRARVVDGVVRAVGDLETTVREHMHCQMAKHKAQVVASDIGLQSDLAVALRRLGGDA